jgi:hypothetical protein
MKRNALPRTSSVIEQHPALWAASVAASGVMRKMAIRPYLPRIRRREQLLNSYLPDTRSLRNQLYRERGDGGSPTIVIGGFVPDATEAVEFQRELFRRFGTVYYLNYSRHGFSAPMFHSQLADLIEDINSRGEWPVIFSVSFGCGLVRDFLERSELEESLRIAGIVMVSPVLCMEDLVRAERGGGTGVRMLESNLRRILRTDPGEPAELDRQMERARRCFQVLFETGAANRPLGRRHLSVRRKIMEVLSMTPAQGGYQRTAVLKDLRPLSTERPLFSGPALALIAEEEESILVPSSPTLAVLNHRQSFGEAFPKGKVLRVASAEKDDPVVHASLIFHQQHYNPLIESWYSRLKRPTPLPVVLSGAGR